MYSAKCLGLVRSLGCRWVTSGSGRVTGRKLIRDSVPTERIRAPTEWFSRRILALVTAQTITPHDSEDVHNLNILRCAKLPYSDYTAVLIFPSALSTYQRLWRYSILPSWQSLYLQTHSSAITCNLSMAYILFTICLDIVWFYVHSISHKLIYGLHCWEIGKTVFIECFQVSAVAP